MTEEALLRRGLLAFVIALTVSIMGCAGIGWLINLDTRGSYMSSRDFTKAAEIAVPRFTDSIGRLSRVRQDLKINAIFFRVPLTSSLLNELEGLPKTGELHSVRTETASGVSYDGYARIESGSLRLGFVPSTERRNLESLRRQMNTPEP
ncbi:MAG TPA: hypothetical protein PKA27_05300 [Fimbriimonadaceae bacterium]|nr:hypothetical protein [Fimbriimonadaceae bacterium]